MVTRKKVLWLIKGLDAGGAEKMLVTSLPYLDRDTFDYQVAYLFKNMRELVPEFEKQGIPVFCPDMQSFCDFKVIFKLRRFLREQKIDILHTHLPYAGIIGRSAAILTGVKANVSTEHGILDSYSPLTRIGTVLSLPLNKAIIAVSQAVARSVLKYKTTSPQKVHVIYNAINIGELSNIQAVPDIYKESLGIDRYATVVGTVSHIRPEKGHRYLIEAAGLVLEKRPDVRFVVVGREKTPQELNRLEDLAHYLGIRDKIIFTGFRQDAFQLMTTFDVFALPSLWEGFAVVILEAMSLGKPVVATHVGGIPEVVEDGVNGFLVAPRDSKQMASRILDLVNNEVLRHRMGEEGKKKIRERFGVEYMVKEVEQVYLSVLKGKA